MDRAYGQSEDFVARRTPTPAQGLRKTAMFQSVRISEIRSTEDHQLQMADFAARAVRWFAEQGWEVEWHTLTFHVEAARESGDQQWSWTVWVR